MLKLFSHMLSPPAVAAVVAVIFSLSSPDTVLSMFLGILFLAAIPLLPFLYLLKKRLTDIEIRRRRARAYVLFIAILSYVASSAIFFSLDNHVMFAISASYALVTSAIFLNNFFWKISIHAAGIAGPTTALVYVFGTSMVPLYALTLFTFYVRLKLKAHSLAQLAGGCAVAIAATLLAFALFY